MGYSMSLKTKLKNLNECRINSDIYSEYENAEVDESIVYLESRNGNDFTGNIFRIAEALSSGKYGDFKLHVYAVGKTKDKINALAKNYNLRIHKIIADENEATKTLEKAKYIFTDSGIRPKFIKKEGQVMMNTWHGTPLKLMGYDNPSERPALGIIQRCLLSSDYLLYPNEYMRDIMLDAYMIDDIYPGKILLEGYPRNSVFLDDEKRNEFRKKLDFEDSEVFVYMPTFKGIVSDRKDEKQKDDVDGFLEKIDSSLKDNQIMLVKFHPYNQSKIDFSKFAHVKAFPDGYENYDVLNACDVLITDYSSVFFDFALSKRKIIIFNYDEEEYLADRGIYFALDELPFPKARTVDELILGMNCAKDYDDSEFLEKFSLYESMDSTDRICNCIINQKIESKCERIESTKKNILVYAENLQDSDTLTLLDEFAKGFDKSEHNLFVSFKPWDKNIKTNHLTILSKIPKDFKLLPLANNIYPTIDEKLNLNKFLSNPGDDNLYGSLKGLFEKSFKKQYGDFKFDLVVDLNSSSIIESLIFANSNCRNAVYGNSNKDICNRFDELYELGEEQVD